MTKQAKTILGVTVAILVVAIAAYLILHKHGKDQEEAKQDVKQEYETGKDVKKPAPANTGSGLLNVLTGGGISGAQKDKNALQRLYDSLAPGSFPVGPGSKNKYAFLVQKMLKEMHHEPITIDGNWGTGTTTAFKKHYQGTSLDRAHFDALMYQYKDWMDKSKVIGWWTPSAPKADPNKYDYLV